MTKKIISIVDYGVGNIGALINIFDHIEIDVEVVKTPEEIQAAHKLVLPGVGAFDVAMNSLRSTGLINSLNTAVLTKGVPVLGICLGMQLMARSSEEGTSKGLGWIDADVKKISKPVGSNLKIPNMGWLGVQTRQETNLFGSDYIDRRFYFNHSYHVVCDSPQNVLATVEYGSTICCAVISGNIYGVQFHPEKSHRHGMNVLSSFANI